MLGFLSNQRFQWWAKNLLHIETLFFIGFVIAMIYFIFFVKDKRDIEHAANKATDILFGDGLSKLGSEELEKYYKSLGLKSAPKKKQKFNKSEERCREIFEETFGCEFKSVRPDWLKNPVTKQNLELDGFAPHIKTPIGTGLAFEYDGIQHSQYNKHFHPNGPDEFIYQTKKDSWKDLKCKENGILLIRIPHYVAYQDLERFIGQKLRRYGM